MNGISLLAMSEDDSAPNKESRCWLNRLDDAVWALGRAAVWALVTVALFVGYVIAGSIVVTILFAFTTVYLACAAVLLVMLTGERPIPYREPMFYHVALVVSSPVLVWLLELAWRRWRSA